MSTDADLVSEVDDPERRLALIRQREILLAFEEYGPGYHRVTGDGCRYVAEIVNATPAEWEWIYAHARTHPEVLIQAGPARNPVQWRQLRREQGEAAFRAADAAFTAGDTQAALDLLDEAHALGAIGPEQWERLRLAVITTADGAR
ncbi:hypothetical protein DLJ59_25860 [Micromonospora inaquosa]|uniref:Uncharacterized protein n=1 Tax=Micromonospora inaquosa TaxID=2203716 RepID=A0A3N9WDV1_9ACTN|nr:hypothetical protein DLJ59_25860 [Micromonospora inaquosa]